MHARRRLNLEDEVGDTCRYPYDTLPLLYVDGGSVRTIDGGWYVKTLVRGDEFIDIEATLRDIGESGVAAVMREYVGTSDIIITRN